MALSSSTKSIMSRAKADLSRSTFNDLVERTKSQLGIKDGQADFNMLLKWLQQEMHGGTAIARINIDADAQCVAYSICPLRCSITVDAMDRYC